MADLRDHPRIRGEHLWKLLMMIYLRGSPPHTRGTRGLCLMQKARKGITPAYAGNTSLAVFSTALLRDHPRIRGEHLRGYQAVRKKLGSPPHTRGTRRSRNSAEFYVGDHPRIRGEHGKKLVGGDYSQGSPPHTRGTP